MSAGVMEDGVTISGATGVPQGGSISPLLSNVYGHALDALWAKEARHLGTIVRYADDAVILCRSEADAQYGPICAGKPARSTVGKTFHWPRV